MGMTLVMEKDKTTLKDTEVKEIDPSKYYSNPRFPGLTIFAGDISTVRKEKSTVRITSTNIDINNRSIIRNR